LCLLFFHDGRKKSVGLGVSVSRESQKDLSIEIESGKTNDGMLEKTETNCKIAPF